MSICILLAVLNQVAPLELEIDSFPYIFTTKLYLESNESWTLDIFMGSKNTELEYTVENEGIWYPVTGERTTIISNGQPTTGEIITLYLKLKSATHSISQLELTFYSNANISIFDEKMCLQANNSIIKITKTQSSGPFYLGDIVSFRYLLKNESDTSIENIIIKDNLPTGIFYVQGTAKLNGTPLPYKTLIPIIESHQEIKLEYSLKITEEAKIGLSFWYTEFSYSGKSDSVLQEIFIEEGVFTKRGIVFGRVTNADGSGIPNTIVRLSNGSISMTDNMGRYHFWGVKDGMHTVFVESDNLSISPKLLWLPKGSVVKADFTPNPQTLEPLNTKTDFLFVALGNMKIEHLLKVPITDNQLIVDSKFAFYFRGKLTGKTIIEAGLDTDRDDMKEIIANIKPNKVYDIYGDKASGGEQQTIGKFYLKLSYSDFNVSYGIGEISLKPLEGSRDEVFAINRPLPYTKVDYSGKVAFTGIGSVQSSTSYKDELRAENKTGPYKLLQPPLIPHSEYISVETRDKNIPDRTINTRIVNSRDYYIDYETGELWFYVPVQSEDIFGNPNFLVIEYLSRLRNPTINHHTILMNLEKKFNYGAIGTKFMKESQVPTDYLLNSVFMRVGKSNGVSTTIEYMLRPGQNEKGIIGKVNIPVKSTTYIGIDYHRRRSYE
ncbi:MAG: carboxypeptidase regulatory-like domain-containing protein [Candidatus Stahlbacteria bacterium]|nr:carboxypeptidase regulatory-like domain-containing protein [Candidatus Stahlbacteria bacterium]